MTLPRTPLSVLKAREKEKKLTIEEKKLSQPVKIKGYTLGTVPQGKYVWQPPRTVQKKKWVTLPSNDWSLQRNPSSPFKRDVFGKYTYEEYRYPAGGGIRIIQRPKLKKGYRYNPDFNWRSYDPFLTNPNLIKHGAIQEYKKVNEWLPGEWKWEDPHKDIRDQLIKAEEERRTKLQSVYDELGKVRETMAKFMRKRGGSVKNRPGTRASKSTILTGGLGLRDDEKKRKTILLGGYRRY
jgi:hypothetical protein